LIIDSHKKQCLKTSVNCFSEPLNNHFSPCCIKIYFFILFEYPAACCGWDGATGDIIRAYIEKHGTPEEKAGYKQMQLLDF
jgi:hypothetical protein